MSTNYSPFYLALDAHSDDVAGTYGTIEAAARDIASGQIEASGVLFIPHLGCGVADVSIGVAAKVFDIWVKARDIDEIEASKVPEFCSRHISDDRIESWLVEARQEIIDEENYRRDVSSPEKMGRV